MSEKMIRETEPEKEAADLTEPADTVVTPCGMELTYHWEGSYLIPDLEMKVTEERPLGKYGRMRLAYLKENDPLQYEMLCWKEEILPHLWEIQDTASRRIEQIMSDLLAQNPAPDKQTNQKGWVQHMNSLKAQAEEIVIRELIFN